MRKPGSGRMKTVIKHVDTWDVIYESNRDSLRGAVREALQDGVLLEGGDLTGVDLSHLNLNGVSFKNCVLNGAKFHGTQLNNSNLTYVEIDGAEFKDVVMHEADLSYSKCRNSKFENVCCEKGYFHYTNMTANTVRDSSFTNCRFRDALLGVSSFGNVKYLKTEFYCVNMRGNGMANVDFSGSQGLDIDFYYAKLNDCNFYRASLYCCSFERAELIGCDFTSTFLGRTTFKETDIKRTVFFNIQGDPEINGVPLAAHQNSEVLKLDRGGKPSQGDGPSKEISK